MDVKILTTHLHKIWQLEILCKSQSFKIAAMEIGVTASALNQTIKSLEAIFQKNLILKQDGNIVLSKDGKELVELVRPILDQLQDLAEISQNIDHLKRVHIGAYDSLGKLFFPKFYKKIHENDPQIDIYFSVGRSQELVKNLKKGKLDMAIVIAPSEADEYDIDVLGINSLSFYANKNFDESTATLDSIKMACIAAQEDGRPAFFSKLLKEVGLKAKQFTIHSDSFEIIKDLTLHEPIISLLPRTIGGAHSGLKCVNHLFQSKQIEELSKHSICLITRKTFPSNWKRHVIDILKS